MGVYIKGMEMPTSCFYCPFREKVNPDDYVCLALNKEFEETFSLIAGKRHKDCPLVSVPEHGRLIDADAALRDGWTISRTYSASPTEMIYEAKTIDCLPTIIPESRGSEDE